MCCEKERGGAAGKQKHEEDAQCSKGYWNYWNSIWEWKLETGTGAARFDPAQEHNCTSIIKAMLKRRRTTRRRRRRRQRMSSRAEEWKRGTRGRGKRETDEANGCSLGCFYERMYATDICTHWQTDTDAHTDTFTAIVREGETKREREREIWQMW